jgi:hypothetical protein
LIVHNDYTITSAPLRLRQLGAPPKVNDVLRKVLHEKPLIDPNKVEEVLSSREPRRYLFINVWRNIALSPVRDMPLALCDAESFGTAELVTFEIRYADRIGENYFAAYRDSHRWVYFPEMVRDEALLLKVWDSAGTIATDHFQSTGDLRDK